MTRVDKSPEQLSAEADSKFDIGDRIAVHRLMYRRDNGLSLNLNQRDGDASGMVEDAYKPDRHPAKPSDDKKTCQTCHKPIRQIYRRYVHGGTNGHWSDVTGLPFNSLFSAYLDGLVSHTDSWNGALLWQRERVCRGRHSTHWQSEWGGSLCYKLVSYVIRQEWGIPEAMGRLGLTDEDLTAKTLESALVAIERRLEWMLYGEAPEVKREVAEWMAKPVEHRVLDGTHSEECPNPICQARRAA